MDEEREREISLGNGQALLRHKLIHSVPVTRVMFVSARLEPVVLVTTVPMTTAAPVVSVQIVTRPIVKPSRFAVPRIDNGWFGGRLRLDLHEIAVSVGITVLEILFALG